MNVDELVGGVLYQSRDPESAARALLRILLDTSKPPPDQVREVGLDPELVEVVRRALPSDSTAIATACALGAAWVRGRRSAEADDAWEPVVTVFCSTRLPDGVRRGTTETLVALITKAKATVRIAAPFVDTIGMGYLAGPLAAATRRGVSVDLFLSSWSGVVEDAVRDFRQTVGREGSWERVRILVTTAPAPWPHLKVVVVDDAAAYIGSANLTGPGLSGRNLELGVLVRGRAVRAIGHVLDVLQVERREFS